MAPAVGGATVATEPLPVEKLELIVQAKLQKGGTVARVFEVLDSAAASRKQLIGHYIVTPEVVAEVKRRVERQLQVQQPPRDDEAARPQKAPRLLAPDGASAGAAGGPARAGAEAGPRRRASPRAEGHGGGAPSRAGAEPRQGEEVQARAGAGGGGAHVGGAEAEDAALAAGIMDAMRRQDEARQQQLEQLRALKEHRLEEMLREMDEQMRGWCRRLAERKQVGRPWRNVGGRALKVLRAPSLDSPICEGRYVPAGATFGVEEERDVDGRRWLRLADATEAEAGAGWVSTTSRKAERGGTVVAERAERFEDALGGEAFQVGEGEDRREAYLRMVHRRSEANLRVPECLKAELMPYQVEGFEWLVSLFNNDLAGLLADEMGLGKTIQTLALVAFLRETKKRYGPHLVICPKSVVANWQKEISRFIPEYEKHTVVFQGTPQDREGLAKKIRHAIGKEKRKLIVVTNYEQVHPDRNKVLHEPTWELVVVDEGHRMKNQKSVFHQTMKDCVKARMKLLLTGTPLQNNLDEFFALLNYLLPEVFSSAGSFKTWFAAPQMGRLEAMGMTEYSLEFTEEEEQLILSNMHAMLAPFLLQRTKASVLSLEALPPRREETLWVPLSAWQERTYEQLKTNTLQRVAASGGEVKNQMLQNVAMQVRKIALHPYLFGRGVGERLPEDLVRASGKLEALDRLLLKLLPFGHKVLVFSQFTSMLDLLQELLVLRRWTFERIDGQVSADERRARIARFSGPGGAFVFLLSSRAGAVGLNLQAADTVVLFDLDWNPQQDKQAIARAHRLGQTKEVLVLRLLTPTPIEQHMERKAEEKLGLEKKIIGAGGFSRDGSTKTPEERAEQLRELLGQPSAGGAAAPARIATPFGDANARLARGPAELAAFEAQDAALGLPGVPAELPVAEALVRCRRLMGAGEVPEAFEAEDESEGSE